MNHYSLDEFYPAQGPMGVTSVDGAGGSRSLDADLHRVRARRVIIDSSQFDTSYNVGDSQLHAQFEPMKKVSGIQLVSCIVPRYFGVMAHAVLTATMESGDRFYLHAFAPQTSNLAHIGNVFKTSLEEDAKRATTSTFSSPWFQALTIKTTDIGFTVLEYYTTAGVNVSSVDLDVTQFDGLADTIKIDYGSGLVTTYWDSSASGASMTNGLWHFSQRKSSVHSKYGCPYLCINGISNVEFGIAGRGNMVTPPICIFSSPTPQFDSNNRALRANEALASVTVDGGVVRRVDVSGGSGYTPNSELDVVVTNAFGSQSEAASVKAMTDSSGVIIGCFIENGGCGYIQAGTTASVTDSGHSGTPATLTVVVARKGVRAVSVTNGGQHYPSDVSARISGVRTNTSSSSASLDVVRTGTSGTYDASGSKVMYTNDVTAVCTVDAVTDGSGHIVSVRILDAGEGYPTSATPNLPDAFCVLMEEGGLDPISSPYSTTRWFKTPLSSIDKLGVSIRCSDGSLYPIENGRSLFVFDIYCENA